MTLMQTMTFAALLSDLRAISTTPRIRAGELDDHGATLIDLGLAEPCYVIGVGHSLRETLDGLDVLFACRDVVLTE